MNLLKVAQPGCSWGVQAGSVEIPDRSFLLPPAGPSLSFQIS